MLSTLNPQQEEAATAGDGPLLIVAGAGTGKTKTLTQRLAHFIRRGIQPTRICAITFTNKAAREMVDRVRTIINGHDHGELTGHNHSPLIGTFHALGAKILREEARLLKRGPNFTIFDDHDSFSLIKKIIKRRLGAHQKNGGGEDRLFRNLKKPALFAQKISEIKNVDSAIPDLKKLGEETGNLILEIFRKYEGGLKENNAFDFDDLIEKPVYLFKKYPGVLKKYQNKFDAILVDEYQDLNPRQYELIKFIAGGHKNLSVVGDDEQMIYGWRYADLRIFLDFEKDWPGAQIKFLEENYRSTQNIIGAASAVAKNNQYRRPKNLWTKNPKGELIKIVEVENDGEEAEWIVSEMRKSDEGYKTAITYRTNAQSRAVEQALIRSKIPYRIFGGLKFYERKEIRDIVAALRYAVNKKDEISRGRLEKSLGKNRFQELAESMAVSDLKNIPPIKLVEKFLRITDYLEYLEKNYLNYDERRENVAELIDFASRFTNPHLFLEEIALVQAPDAPSKGSGPNQRSNEENQRTVDPIRGREGSQRASASNGVDLMTIHLSKGLEFDRVFIAGCSEGLLPHARSQGDQYKLEEERRLMYVAMTRAKKLLYISFYDLPSRFLGEIPPETTETLLTTSAENEDADTERCVVLD